MAGLMTWTRHWAPVIVVAWLAAAVLLAYTHHAIKTRYQARQRRLDQLIADEEARIDRLMPHIGMRTGMTWPDDLCAFPPCGWEDNWVCSEHRQPEPGKHRLGSSQSRGHDVIQAIVTDLPEPWDSRWAR